MIISKEKQEEFYHALINKNSLYDGIFFVGVKTTGVFCHPTCRAKKPKFENCEFFLKAESALLSGFRPCKICHPLYYPNNIPNEVKLLVDLVEKNPEHRWKNNDFEKLGINSASARRKFKDVYNMTFIQYARARRMGIAFKEILNGTKVIDQQIASSYESASGFNDAFTKIMGNSPKKTNTNILNANIIETPIGRMISLTNEKYLFLLEFLDRRGLELEIEKLRNKYNVRIIYGNNKINHQLEKELNSYFLRKLKKFSIPLFKDGSLFQMKVWTILENIAIGTTLSYQDIANKIDNPKAVRAVANANGANKISILIPCHRVIRLNGDIGGYGGGIERKKYLLNLEKYLLN